MSSEDRDEADKRRGKIEKERKGEKAEEKEAVFFAFLALALPRGKSKFSVRDHLNL